MYVAFPVSADCSQQLEKGKPRESVGRKATGLTPLKTGYGSGVARRRQHLMCWISRGQLNPVGGVADGNSKGFLTTSKM